MAVEDFLNALRRFVARRGVPDSITSDNAPTFLLSAEILNSDANKRQICSTIQNATALREIEWRTITPYAPWQGGVYERLIKSIKHALYKSLRGKPHNSLDSLTTILTEVEACLNSRPLTYQGAQQDGCSSIRPIDFIQRDMDVILLHDFGVEDSAEDPEYLLPERMTTLKTRKEVECALKSSCKYTERFWNIWQNHYLTSLRETHKRYVTTKRHHPLIPKVGTVVLINDPILPRNDWKMARITGTRLSGDGKIREVELITATKRKIKRPVNLVTPLEIIDDSESLENANENGSEDKNASTIEQRRPYNLRPRRPVCYADDSVATNFVRETTPFSGKWFLFYIMLLALAARTLASTTQEASKKAHPDLHAERSACIVTILAYEANVFYASSLLNASELSVYASPYEYLNHASVSDDIFKRINDFMVPHWNHSQMITFSRNKVIWRNITVVKYYPSDRSTQ